MLPAMAGGEDEWNGVREGLKRTPCPRCKTVGALIRHGYLRGYDETNNCERVVRAWRIFCSNRKLAAGCGRTFSVWAANKIRRLSLTTVALWMFLTSVAGAGKLHALDKIDSGLGDSAPYRIWRRFARAQAAIRTALCQFCPPPTLASDDAHQQTLAHLEAAFPGESCPITAYQMKLQTFFL